MNLFFFYCITFHVLRFSCWRTRVPSEWGHSIAGEFGYLEKPSMNEKKKYNNPYGYLSFCFIIITYCMYAKENNLRITAVVLLILYTDGRHATIGKLPVVIYTPLRCVLGFSTLSCGRLATSQWMERMSKPNRKTKIYTKSSGAL